MKKISLGILLLALSLAGCQCIGISGPYPVRSGKYYFSSKSKPKPVIIDTVKNTTNIKMEENGEERDGLLFQRQ